MKKIINIVSPWYFPTVNGLSHLVQQNVEVLIGLDYEVNVFTTKDSISVSNETVHGFDMKGNGSLLSPIKGEVEIFLNCMILNSVNVDLIIVYGWHSSFTNVILDNKQRFTARICLYSHE